MSDILDNLRGFDHKKQIFDLWYEITFIRAILSHIVEKNLYLKQIVSEQELEAARQYSEKIVKEKFPLFEISFPENSNQSKNTGEDSAIQE